MEGERPVEQIKGSELGKWSVQEEEEGGCRELGVKPGNQELKGRDFQ